MGLAVHVISSNPVILHGYDWQCGVSPFMQLYPALVARPATLLLSLSWTLMAPRRLAELVEAAKVYHSLAPHHKLVVLANMPEEKKLLEAQGISSVLCPHNALLDENIYKPLSLDKEWTAVINARMARFKRIELARDVQRTCLITYQPPQHNNAYENELRANMPYMDWPQYENGRWSRYFSADTVCNFYARSRVGLMLSEIEGGCFASSEYLLSGLPVVSTPNLGGRDLFFHPDYVWQCQPTCQSVNEAVENALRCTVPPEEIHQRTVGIMQRYRKHYVALLNREARRMGHPRDFESLWPEFYVNKMLKNHADYNTAVQALAEAGVCAGE